MKLALQLLLSFSDPSAQFHCLQENIFHEARNQSVDGMRAVATVTVNRTINERFPDTICGVVTQSRTKGSRKVCQFSWVCQNRAVRLHNRIEREAWATAGFVAAITLAGFRFTPIDDALFYHTKAVNPVWNRKMDMVAAVDDHLFFKG